MRIFCSWNFFLHVLLGPVGLTYVSSYAKAESVFSVSCPTAAQIDPYVMMCGHNRFVALQARYCADELVDSWRNAAQSLVPVLQSRGQVRNQSHSEANTSRNYLDAIRSIEEQVVQMQRYTAIVADYPKIMIDLPNSQGDATSLSCFNDAFHQVQEIVTYLDGEIVRAKKVRESAISLMSVSDARQQGLATSLSKEITKSTANAPLPIGSTPRSASTITGEIRQELLRSKNAATKLERRIPKTSSPPFYQANGNVLEKDRILADFSSSTSLERGRPKVDSSFAAGSRGNTSGASVPVAGAEAGKMKKSRSSGAPGAVGEFEGRKVANDCSSDKVEVLSCTAEAVGSGSDRVYRVVAKVRNRLARTLRDREPVVGIRAETKALLNADVAPGAEGTARGDYKIKAKAPAVLEGYFFAVSALAGPACGVIKRVQCTLIDQR